MTVLWRGIIRNYLKLNILDPSDTLENYFYLTKYMIQYTDDIDVDVDQLLKSNKFYVILGTTPLFLLTYTRSYR